MKNLSSIFIILTIVIVCTTSSSFAGVDQIEKSINILKANQINGVEITSKVQEQFGLNDNEADEISDPDNTLYSLLDEYDIIAEDEVVTVEPQHTFKKLFLKLTPFTKSGLLKFKSMRRPFGEK